MTALAEILTEDQRLLLAAAGTSTLLRMFTDPDYGIACLFDSHRVCTITDEAYAPRPEWKAARVSFAVDPKHGVHLMRSLPRDSPDAPKVSISRKRLHAYAASLPPAWIEALRGLRGSYRLTVDDAVWQALLLPGRPCRDQMEQINAGSSKTTHAATVDRMPDEHEYEPVETVALGDKVAELLTAWESGEPLTGGAVVRPAAAGRGRVGRYRRRIGDHPRRAQDHHVVPVARQTEGVPVPHPEQVPRTALLARHHVVVVDHPIQAGPPYGTDRVEVSAGRRAKTVRVSPICPEQPDPAAA
ncbi:hypothetical protein ACFXPS_05535 [Nocardia sp. NPDC059091]|uniref:hypothetical protein n=1 Tax=Nocardia sp. NPDC059091 TaxID=3346724 RepID=UPI00369CD0D2